MSAPHGWKLGDPLTPEMKAKREASIAANRERKAAGKAAPKPPRRPGRPRLETAPVRVGGAVTEKMRRKIVSLVARLVLVVDASAAWTAKRMDRPVYALDPATKKVLLDDKKRPIIEGRVRAVSDETIAADRLEEWERDWLAEELTNELLQYKRIRLFLVRMVELEERSSLPMCVTMIALPRLVRHGIFPSEFTGMVEEMRQAARKARHAPKSEPIAPPIPEPEVTVSAAAE